MPQSGSYADFRPTLLGDSTKPKHLRGILHVTPKNIPAETGGTIAVEVVATNTGAAAWLPSDAPNGPVRLGARVLNSSGEILDDDYWRSELPFRRTTFPGEVVAFEAEIPWDGTGERILDFDLVAEGVAWFNLEERPRIPVGRGSLSGRHNRPATELSAVIGTTPLEQRLCVLADDYKRLAETAAQIETKNAELTGRIDAVEVELAAMRASTSWRITAPLRAIKRAIRRR